MDKIPETLHAPPASANSVTVGIDQRIVNLEPLFAAF